jgi:hypothetical protein
MRVVVLMPGKTYKDDAQQNVALGCIILTLTLIDKQTLPTPISSSLVS